MKETTRKFDAGKRDEGSQYVLVLDMPDGRDKRLTNEYLYNAGFDIKLSGDETESLLGLSDMDMPEPDFADEI